MKNRTTFDIVINSALLFFLAISFSCAKGKEAILKEFPVNDLSGIISKDIAKLDDKVSSDGAGSARFEISTPGAVKLFETGDLDVEEAKIVYSAK